MDKALQTEQRAEFVGNEIIIELAELAEQIGRTGPGWATITDGDSFLVDLPEADVVVSAPALGAFGGPREPWLLLNGREARELEIAARDLCLRKLRPGGRAVMLLPNSITFRANLESYRHYLSTEFRVGVLIVQQSPLPGHNIGMS